MAKQDVVFPITSEPFELSKGERKLIAAAMPPLPRALAPTARAMVATAIEAHLDAAEALTAFLDAMDGDPDLEPYLAGTSGDDREPDAGDEAEAGADDDLSCEDLVGGMAVAL